MTSTEEKLLAGPEIEPAKAVYLNRKSRTYKAMPPTYSIESTLNSVYGPLMDKVKLAENVVKDWKFNFD